MRENEAEERRDASINGWIFTSAVISPRDNSNVNSIVDQRTARIALAGIAAIFARAEMSFKDFFLVVDSLTFFV